MSEHRSRFKHYLISPSQLKAEALQLREALMEFQRAYEQDEIHAGEWATLFVALYLNHRQSKWWMKKSQPWRQSDDSFLAFCLSQLELLKLPGSIGRTLYFWQRGEYSLLLASKAVTPYQMLRQQAEGRRVVTLAQEQALHGRLVDGERDALEFLLHDLVHAGLFFESREHFEAQKNFFTSVLRLVDGGHFEDYQSNAEFQKDFHYLISDMNSHPAHLAAHLKASYVKHLLALEGKTAKQELSGESKKHLADRLVYWQREGAFEVSLDA